MGEESTESETDVNSAEGKENNKRTASRKKGIHQNGKNFKIASEEKSNDSSSNQSSELAKRKATNKPLGLSRPSSIGSSSSSLHSKNYRSEDKPRKAATADTKLLVEEKGEKKNDSSDIVKEKNGDLKLRLVPLETLLAPEKKVRSYQTQTQTSGQVQRRSIRTTRSQEPIIVSSDSEDSVSLVLESVEPVIKKSQKRNSQRATEKVKKDKGESRISSKRIAVKRCVVRLQRVTLPVAGKKAKTTNQEELPSTSKGARKELGMEKPSGTAKTRSASAAVKPRKRDSSESDDDDFEAVKSKQSAAEDQNSSGDSAAAKSSDSEIMPVRKKRVFNKRKRSSSNESDFEPEEKKTTVKKRGRVKRHSGTDSDDGKKKNGKKNADGSDDEKNKHKRKHIHKIIKTKDLDVSTKKAKEEEEQRRKRIEERQKIYNQIYEQPDSVEVTELVLDFDEETKEKLLEVDRGLLKKLKPHQVTGVKFMWDACFETLKEAEDKPGSGCILAHCMGLGKTLQVVALSHTLITNARKTSVERVLVISPLSTLNNWAREFVQWMGYARKRNIEVYDMSRYKDKATRIFKLNEWFEEGGVCILGYDMYRILANEKAKGLRKKQREVLQQSLVEPGPDLVVCDEGHLLKNEKTSISQAVTKMRTKRRIVLTGTPLQNNLKEYYCMIQFVKPNLLGTYKEYLNRFVNPITNGQYTDSTERDIRLMRHRAHILHKMLEGCIQRRDYSVLAPYLPPKHEYVVYTTLSDLQQQLYEFYMTTQRDISTSDLGGRGARLFQDFQDLRRIWTHPMSLRVNSDVVIRKRMMANDSDSMEDFICDEDDNDEESGSSSDSSVDSSKSFSSGSNSKSGVPIKGRKTRNNAETDSDIEEVIVPEKDDPSEWWKRFVEEKELNNINHSPKLVMLMKLLEQCEAIGDKLLVFSQSLQSLDVIEHFLALIDNKTKGNEYEGDVGDFKGRWALGTDYFRLDGSSSVENREAMCKKFNDVKNLRTRLFLISTRAGGLGINLVAANRVVIFDVSWNPSHDTQSIFRVYRFGQEKPSYIYRLIAMGTMEQKVYERQVAKQATAKRVIDEQQISRHYNQSDLLELYTYELRPIAKRERPNLPKDRLFAELLTKLETHIYKYHEHDSLLENEESENLNEDERKAAWDEYEQEKTRSVQTSQYMSYDRGAFGQLANGQGTATSNKIFGFRTDVLLQLLNMKIAKDQPELNPNQIIQLVPGYLERLYAEMNNGDPTMYKELLLLHSTLAHPSGMYMNPLLYANQNPQAAGYFQAPGVQQQQQVDGVAVIGGAIPPANGDTAVAAKQLDTPVAGSAVVAADGVAGFAPGAVYEID